MLFELRTHTPDVSPQWTEVRNLFLDGDSREAWTVASSLRNRVPLSSAADFLLNMEVARACSVHQTYLALGKIAVRRFPDDVWIQFYYARILLTRQMFLEGIDYLKSRESTLGQTHRAQWAAALANTYASAGFEESCLKWLEVCEQAESADDPLCLYTQASALEDLKKWDSALTTIRRCVKAAPNWTRARSYLVHCLLSRSHTEEAGQHLQEASNRGHEDVTIEFTAALIPMSLGHFSTARKRLEETLQRWPQTDMAPYLRRTLCILLVELGDYAAAKQCAAGDEEKFGFPQIPDRPSGRHCFIPLPLMAQNRNQCVPTTVAMAVSVDGHQYDPDVMFQEMHGREGTALWRAREWGNQHGLTTIPVELDRDAIREMLDAGVPLIGTLEGPFNSHVDVVCGYNDDLETFYIRDPEHWAPFALPWETLVSRYQLHNGLLALVSNDRKDVIQKAEQHRSNDGTALLDLALAVARGNVEAAELAYEQIADDSPSAILRESYAVNVVISPVTFRERMKQISQDKDAHPMAHFRAILSMGPDDAEECLHLLLDEKERLRAMVGRYLLLNQAMARGEWPEAQQLLERLMVRGGGIAAFWEMKSDILAELGDHVGSKEALDAAIELEPLRVTTREKALTRAADRLKLQEYLKEFEALLADDPENKRLLISRAQLLLDGPDGTAYEQAAREALHWFPRSPDSYFQLLNWYDLQTRPDLVESLLESGRRFLPEVFSKDDDSESDTAGAGSHAEGESDDSASSEAATSEAATSEGATSEAASPEPQAQTENRASDSVDDALPEGNDELIELLWKPSDERREAAVTEALHRQQQGKLPWYLVARLVAARLLIPDIKGQDLQPPADVLPLEPPGAAHWFVNAVCDSATEIEPSISLAIELEAWMRTLVPNIQDYPEVWFSQILMLEHAQRKQAALEQLQELIKRYPAKSSALYRLGIVAHGQGDYAAARKYFEQALEVNPGLIGAMNGLRDVCSKQGDLQEGFRCTQRLRKKMPHATTYLLDEILETVDLESVDAADAITSQAILGLPIEESILLQAEVFLRTDRHAQAEHQLEQLSLENDRVDDIAERWLRLNLQLARRNEDSVRILEICEDGLQRWPDSNVLLELKAEVLSETDPAAAVCSLKDVILKGNPQAETVSMYLHVVGGNPEAAARRIVEEADEDRQLWLAELFTEITGRSQLLASHGSLLEWGVEKFPDSDLLLYRLTLHDAISGRTKKAIRNARKLYERNPDHPEAARILGQCLIDQKPKDALKYLQEAADVDRNTSVLFDLARCRQIMGDVEKAKSLHREIIQTNPLASASWTNLYILGESHDRLKSLMVPILEQGLGIDDEYFLVANVKLAVSCGIRLPEVWLSSALRRWEILKTYPGFGDERVQLKNAINAWIAVRPQDAPAEYPEFGGLLAALKRFSSYFSWPGRKWVPAT